MSLGKVIGYLVDKSKLYGHADFVGLRLHLLSSKIPRLSEKHYKLHTFEGDPNSNSRTIHVKRNCFDIF